MLARLLMVLLCAFCAIARADDIVGQTVTLPSGKETITGTVSSLQPDGVTITTDVGITRVRYADMAPADRDRLGYNPIAEAAYIRRLREQQAAAAASAQKKQEETAAANAVVGSMMIDRLRQQGYFDKAIEQANQDAATAQRLQAEIDAVKAIERATKK
jgi:hypothetical protein